MTANASGRGRRGRTAAAAVLLAAIAGCDRDEPAPPASPPASASAVVSPRPVVPAIASDVPMPRRVASASNPLGLELVKIKLDPGRRVFTFPEAMLAGARPGTTLVLHAATVVGFEGDDLIIEGRGESSYKVHPGYVIPVPDTPRVRLHDPVLTEWNGTMKHAVVTRFVKDRIEVRYTDMSPRTRLGMLKDVRFVRQVDGLVPGNYAALKDGDAWRHVLLVSHAGAAGAGRWFALGYGGAAMIVNEAALRPIPISAARLKVGAAVWAEWVGMLRPAAVQSLDDIGYLTVKFERVGRPVRLGWGLVTPPLEAATP